MFNLFILIFLSFVVLAFRPFLGRRSLGEVGWPFTGVLRETTAAVTESFERTADYAAKVGWLLCFLTAGGTSATTVSV